jgi:carboxylesterase type B
MHAVLMDGGVAGKRVLVAGGAGAVSHYALQLASRMGAAQLLTTVSSDSVNCGTRRFARALSDGGAPTWLFAFEAEPRGVLPETYDFGAFHTADLVFLFDTNDVTGRVATADRGRWAMRGY